MALGLIVGCKIIENNPDYKFALVAGEVIIGSVLILGVLEKLIPYRLEWSETQEDVKNDTIHLFFTQILIGRIMEPIWLFVLAGATAWLAGYYGSTIWPDHWTLLAQLALALLIAEFGRYWVHRAAHEVPLLWRFHAVHHSPTRLYFLNASRFHPVEKIIFLIPETIPFILLGTNPDCLILYAIFNSIHGFFQHSNIDIKTGYLNYIFSLTELHRWHHSKKIYESNKNYGNNLIIWDIVFGTFYWPKSEKVKSVGLLNPEYPKDYLGQFTAPFQGEIDKPIDYKTNPKKYASYHES